MSSCFATNRTVFFVGGRGTKDGHATPGGATLDWFQTKGSGFALSDIMDANGGPINSVTTGHGWTAATKTLAPAHAGDFDGAGVGMIVYVSDQTVGGPHITTGRYVITTVTGTDPVTALVLNNMTTPADYDNTNGTNVTVVIGGAFATMDAAIGASSSLYATFYDVHVFDNKDETAMTEIVLGVTGSVANNSMLRYWGFNTAPGDHLPGGASEGTWTAKAAGNNTLLDPEARDNIALYCMHLQNNAAADGTIEPGTSTDEMCGWLLQHCKLENLAVESVIFNGVWKPLLIYDCSLHTADPFAVLTTEAGGVLSGMLYFVDCTFDVDYSSTGCAVLATGHASVFVNCVVTGDTYGSNGFINGCHYGTVLVNCTNAKGDNPSGQNATLARLNNAQGWAALIRSTIDLADAGDDQILAWVRQDSGGTLATVIDCNAYSDTADAAGSYLCQDHLDAAAPGAATEIHNWWWLPSTYCRQVENDLDSDYQTQNDTLERGASGNLAIGLQLPRYAKTLPTTPTVTVAAGTLAFTATIAGDAGVTNYLKYKIASGGAWLDGGSRSGDGDITVSSLNNDVTYIIVVYSINDLTDVVSLPSYAQTVSFSSTAEGDFESDLADNADELLTAFGETVYYLPNGGGSREILGIIDYEGVSALSGTPFGTGPAINVTVKNDDTDGISTSEIDIGKDLITISTRIGKATENRRLVSIISEDAGMVTLEVR